MFDRMTVRVPEATRLKIILKNLAPYSQNQLGLSPITSRDQLLEASRVLEARKASVECYVQPTRRRGQICLEPDLAYVQVEASSPKSSTASSLDVRPVKAISGKCWNCGKPNHSFRSFLSPGLREKVIVNFFSFWAEGGLRGPPRACGRRRRLAAKTGLWRRSSLFF
jgi:hypothetical protein